ncbi:MAG: acyl-CoA dehydrogenase family protein [Gammaproteobacteria bacterium]|nr:MAG: acyl-CoA dehydrogenase [Gammaproteobacteria bacterium TMED242]|tara:strand:+ start:1436 stop:2524 length:1089 start_codon:yes stop_codon:yes gene_type:complete
MYFGLSEDQKFFQENVSKFLEDQSNLDVIRKITEGEANEIQQEIHDGLVNLGLGSLLIPEQYGGLGLDLLFATAVSQSLGEGLGPIPFAGSYIMAPLAIMHGGNQEQKNNYLTKMSENSMRIGVGFSEYIGARDNANISINDNKISGRALFVIDAKDASHLMLSDKNGMIGIVESSSSGIEITELVAVDKTRNFLEVQLKDVDIDILELTSTSKEAIDKSIDAGRIILAADSLGASQALIDKAVEYSKERKQFNRVIGSFQAVKHMCAEMAADLEPCYALVWHAAHCFDNSPDESRLMACHAKSHVSEVSKTIGKKATEVHGGMGFTDLMGVHYWFKRIGVNRQTLGAPEVIREEAARIQNF